MRRLARFAPVVLLLLAVWPGTARAQTVDDGGRGVGVVTTLMSNKRSI